MDSVVSGTRIKRLLIIDDSVIGGGPMAITLRRTGLFAVLVSVLFCAGCGRRVEERKPPQEISSAIFDSVFTLIQKGEVSSREDFEAARNEIARGLVHTVDTDSLVRADSLVYGRLLFWSGRNDGARAIFDELQSGFGDEAREASLELITMEIETGDPATAEEMLKRYRMEYPPGPENTTTLYDQCESLGGRYNDMNLIEEAVRVYVDELNSLPFDMPYKSYALLTDLVNVCQETDDIDAYRKLLRDCSEGLDKGFADYVGRTVYADSTEEANDRNPEAYRSLVRNCGQLLDRLNLIGKPAPPIDFLKIYNADTSLTLESLKGKVIVLDFWATWCLPCVIGFSELKGIYGDYRDKGLEIVGITSLQRYYADEESGVVEKDLEPEREIELTGEFIEQNGIVWPCAISKQKVFNPEYTVNSIPTFVLIDREGYVRFIQSFAGQAQQKRRLIERLL
jgi:thiol-disulfide isomerase/thioredoxin